MVCVGENVYTCTYTQMHERIYTPFQILMCVSIYRVYIMYTYTRTNTHTNTHTYSPSARST